MRYFIFSSLCVALIFPASSSGTDVKLLHDVFDVTSKLLKFFASDYEQINLDGLFGMRLGQGQLKEAIRSCKTKTKCLKSAFIYDLVNLEEKVEKTCSNAVKIVKSNSPDYFVRFQPTVDSSYDLPSRPYTFTPEDLGKAKIGSNVKSYDEEKGDACYARLLGTYIENGRTFPKCNVTKDCWEFMTSSDTQRYSITHQLLYFILMDKIQCTEKVEHYVGDIKVRDVERRLCGNIYKESRQMAASGDVAFPFRDLFMEQTSLCGPLGFTDFINKDWIKMVLQWPDKNDGCFKDYFHLINNRDTYETNVSTMRKLLREKNMKDGCLSHTSGLGFSTFCTFLRYLVGQM